MVQYVRDLDTSTLFNGLHKQSIQTICVKITKAVFENYQEGRVCK